jgi:hypothetical protein
MTSEAEVYNALKYRMVTTSDGTRIYYNHAGQFHREDGPAVIYTDNSCFWYQNDLRHREDGPAVEWPDGTKEWWYNNLRHCTTGPAVIYESGYKCWFLNGVEYTESNYPTKLAALGLADDK